MKIYQWESDGLWCDCDFKEMLSAKQNGFNTRTLHTESKEITELLSEVSSYLNGHVENSIYCGSKLHMKIKEYLSERL